MISSFSSFRPMLAGLAVLTALSGCSPMTPGATPALDARFGEAVREARVRQTINPQASRNTDPVAGIDGAAAQGAIVEYHKSFQEPAPTFNVLGIGSTGGVGR
jgi:hypothetical protein